MKVKTLRQLRLIHLYLGLFFAPMILLFALSGALQTFRLNEPKGWGGPPPTWMVWVATIHKNQTEPRPRPPGAEAPAPRDAKPGAHKAPEGPSPLPLKILTVIMSIALIASTVTGMVIAFNLRAARTGSLVAFAIGTVLPIVLLKL